MKQKRNISTKIEDKGPFIVSQFTRSKYHNDGHYYEDSEYSSSDISHITYIKDRKCGCCDKPAMFFVSMNNCPITLYLCTNHMKYVVLTDVYYKPLHGQNCNECEVHPAHWNIVLHKRNYDTHVCHKCLPSFICKP